MPSDATIALHTHTYTIFYSLLFSPVMGDSWCRKCGAPESEQSTVRREVYVRHVSIILCKYIMRRTNEHESVVHKMSNVIHLALWERKKQGT